MPEFHFKLTLPKWHIVMTQRELEMEIRLIECFIISYLSLIFGFTTKDFLISIFISFFVVGHRALWRLLNGWNEV